MGDARSFGFAKTAESGGCRVNADLPFRTMRVLCLCWWVTDCQCVRRLGFLEDAFEVFQTETGALNGIYNIRRGLTVGHGVSVDGRSGVLSLNSNARSETDSKSARSRPPNGNDDRSLAGMHGPARSAMDERRQTPFGLVLLISMSLER